MGWEWTVIGGGPNPRLDGMWASQSFLRLSSMPYNTISLQLSYRTQSIWSYLETSHSKLH